jgi:hypothetical protein
METIRRILLVLLFLLSGYFVGTLSGDPPLQDPPPPPGGHGLGGNQSPTGAPIDGGLGMLVVIGTVAMAIRICRNPGSGQKR